MPVSASGLMRYSFAGTMSDWLIRLSHSFADQTATWFVGVVLGLMSLFSGKLVETIKFALNRADLRAKYYEEMATEISRFVFIIDRTVRVYYGSSWASNDDKGAIAGEYNEVMNRICSREYMYLHWFKRFWGKKESDAFAMTMNRIREVDAILIELNEHPEHKGELVAKLQAAFHSLQQAAHTLLVSSS